MFGVLVRFRMSSFRRLERARQLLESSPRPFGVSCDDAAMTLDVDVAGVAEAVEIRKIVYSLDPDAREIALQGRYRLRGTSADEARSGTPAASERAVPREHDDTSKPPRWSA